MSRVGEKRYLQGYALSVIFVLLPSNTLMFGSSLYKLTIPKGSGDNPSLCATTQPHEKVPLSRHVGTCLQS